MHEVFVSAAGVFMPPLDFMELVSREQAPIPKNDFFNNPAHQPVKDAWQGGVFSVGYEELAAGRAVEVRLSSQDDFPDFQVRLDGTVHDFEAVMAVTRPLGRLYRDDASRGPVVSGPPAALPQFDVTPLMEALRRKMHKHYGGAVHLLIYLNYKGGGADAGAVEEALRREVDDKFESVWVIARGRRSGEPDKGAYFLSCAKGSPLLGVSPGTTEIRRLQGGNL